MKKLRFNFLQILMYKSSLKYEIRPLNKKNICSKYHCYRIYYLMHADLKSAFGFKTMGLKWKVALLFSANFDVYIKSQVRNMAFKQNRHLL